MVALDERPGGRADLQFREVSPSPCSKDFAVRMEARLHRFLDVIHRSARRRSIVSFGSAIGEALRSIVVDGRLLACVRQSVARRLLFSRARFSLLCCHLPPSVEFAGDGRFARDRPKRLGKMIEIL